MDSLNSINTRSKLEEPVEIGKGLVLKEKPDLFIYLFIRNTNLTVALTKGG